jgi:leader peptidase (prepilin peptidase)/N-methyltransferase
MLVVFIFLIGLAIGSFLNVLIDRLPRGEAVLKGRSYCEKCKKKLAWHDLIPVVSFSLLKAKCRYCRVSLSFYYPTIEIITGIAFVAVSIFILNNFQFSIFNFQSIFNVSMSQVLNLVYCLFIVSSLIIIFFSDLKYGIIPDKIVYPAIIIAAIFNFQFSIFNYLLSAIGAFLFLYFLMIGVRVIFKKEGMGQGDVKLAILMGLFLGFPKIVVGLYLAFLTGAIVGVILILCKLKKLRGSTIPFGPFLVAGTLLSLFYSDFITKLLSRIF